MAKNSPDEGKSTKMVEKQVDPSFNNLKEYRAKRQFSETPEPMADTVETLYLLMVGEHVVAGFALGDILKTSGPGRNSMYLIRIRIMKQQKQDGNLRSCCWNR